MSESALSSYSFSALRDDTRGHSAEPPGDSSTVRALRVMVRRVLRTQDGRPGFGARVLEQARFLREKHGRNVGRDAFERLIVDQLLRSRPDGRLVPARQEKSPVCPTTWERVVEVTCQTLVPTTGNHRPCQKEIPNHPRPHNARSGC